MNPNSDAGLLFVNASFQEFKKHKSYVDKAIAQISDEALHQSLDPNTNSIAVIMKHVGGNLLSRWTDFLTTDGDKPSRNRDDEFVEDLAARSVVIERWEAGFNCLFNTLNSLTAADLLKIVTIRTEPHTVPLAIARSLAHTAYHTGQIVQIARIHAKDHWITLTIPRGGSNAFNQAKRQR